MVSRAGDRGMSATQSCSVSQPLSVTVPQVSEDGERLAVQVVRPSGEAGGAEKIRWWTVNDGKVRLRVEPDEPPSQGGTGRFAPPLCSEDGR